MLSPRMRPSQFCSLAVVSLTFAIVATGPIAGQSTDFDPSVKPLGPVQVLAKGFRFTEGPTVDRQGNLYFTDIPNQRIHRIDPTGKQTIFREPSNQANGLMDGPGDELFACEMNGALVALTRDGKSRRVLADAYQGQRLNAPNDLVLDRAGGIYFTDPEYGSPKPLPQGKTAVYYRAENGTITRLIDDLKNPNGIILSPDEQTLYVIPSSQSTMMSYPVISPGKLGPAKLFCTLEQPMGKTNSGGDGLTVDTQGNLYITSDLGIQIIAPTGKRLGIIAVPEIPANVTFGGKDGKTLIMTARTTVYSIAMPIAGHRFPGKVSK
ncbi:SMP-30/gluconolactonase/LRE family protein [Tuwongella immobilis]|uniref:SMP-30/Gluconolactonase/LRE-like region domain-containing protein n=1 Tax=Tuwongella immobilis TaxID=692036 RepID=A0A6C2YK50_9BACT|nr:SMP-30/gluconolactonase/LRE family protein [Tuwongella immobilis]VIP01958.1 Gluconolactonase OS=Planctomyces maris DSM 8797 GN=PM8797T_21308 PE=4 SV=1: SGL [Tuwongella immobilis]VTR99961.1 Gluconolactonase OS=Planctomyces maris DSM 8797 GN=PM8797T_21308 PE=4 SV=1: SGL [Tuwongella immobilis]